jgi:hypothetical protein
VSNILLGVLVAMDVVLLAVVWVMARRRDGTQSGIIEELAEERRLLAEQQRAVQDDLEMMQEKARSITDRITQLAVEVEQEVRSGRDSLSAELDKIAATVATRFDGPLREMGQRQAGIENLFKMMDAKKEVLQRLIGRGEQIGRIFDKSVPYEQVMHDIQERKYSDARALMARGFSLKKIAQELSLTESETRLVMEVNR